MSNVGMGIDAALRMPQAANKYLGNFATLRNSVFLLATAVSGALFKFGDSAMSRAADRAGQQGDSVKGALANRNEAANMAMESAKGAGRAAQLSAIAGGVHGWDNFAKGNAANEFGQAARRTGQA